MKNLMALLGRVRTRGAMPDASDPFRHPDVRRMSQRELADLPFTPRD